MPLYQTVHDTHKRESADADTAQSWGLNGGTLQSRKINDIFLFCILSYLVSFK